MSDPSAAANPVAVEVHCARCRGAVNLQVMDWNPEVAAVSTTWRCPHCKGENASDLPGVLAWAAKGN